MAGDITSLTLHALRAEELIVREAMTDTTPKLRAEILKHLRQAHEALEELINEYEEIEGLP